MAFQACSNLDNITLPDGVTSIDDQAFKGCSSLESITLPDGVTSIAHSTFMGCSSLGSVTLPDGLTSIGWSAFDACSSLGSITIPNSVTSIEGAAFYECSSLTNVKILNDNISIGTWAFQNCTRLTNLEIAVSENISAMPSVKIDSSDSFAGCPAGRSLTFLTKDGKTKLSDTTTPKLADVVSAYDAADGIDNDNMWYGWKLISDTPDIPDTLYQVTIKPYIDGDEWNDCGKTFALSSDNGGTFITDLAAVPKGTYTIYDTTAASTSAGYVNTYVTVEVKDGALEARVNYCTVTFYNDDVIFSGQIVPKDTKVGAPSDTPAKEGYIFYRWVTSKGGSTEFDFGNSITEKTDIYASWIEAEEKTFTITASAGAGGSVSPSGEVKVKTGDNQRFTITPEEGYRISSVLVDENEALESVQAVDYARVGITDAQNNAKYYDFENVTNNHTLAASFEAIQTGSDSGSGGTGDGDDSGGDTDGTTDSGSSGVNTDNNDGSGNTISAISSDMSVASDASIVKTGSTSPASPDREPKTGDSSHMEVYATIAMIAGLSYILLYFADGKSGMTEEEKKEIVAALVNWAKKGSRVKKYAALAVIFLILVYYHSIGKRTSTNWKEVYEK